MNVKMKWPALAVAVALLTASGTLYAADMIKGGKIYASHCAGCHGAGGNGAMPGTPNFRQGERLMQPDMMLHKTLQSGKNACPSFRGILSDNDIMDVISHLRTLH